MTTRQQKVEELIKIEVSDIIQREMKDPRMGFVTVTGVDTSPDLRYARVYFSVLGDETQKKGSMKALKSAAGFVRAELGKRIRMRTIPEIEFRFDTTIEEGARIFELLQKIKQDEPDEG
jgi:ribosome-binding factor A